MIADKNGKNISSIERELKAMEVEGLLESRKMRVRYAADKMSPAKVYRWV